MESTIPTYLDWALRKNKYICNVRSTFEGGISSCIPLTKKKVGIQTSLIKKTCWPNNYIEIHQSSYFSRGNSEVQFMGPTNPLF
jgi:hypothetical protein